jgi:phospholipase/carboxylesterase
VHLPQGLPWLSVRAPLRHPSFGYAWYPLEGENFAPAAEVAAATSALWEFIDATLPADTLLIPVGFSQGGFMATQMLRTRPDRLAATVVLAGFVAPFEMPADAALAQERRPVFWGRGDADPVIPLAAVEHTVAWLPGHSRLEQRVYRGLGHSVSEQELAHMTDFIAREWRALTEASPGGVAE